VTTNFPAFPPELLQGCRNALIDYMKIQPGNEVVILNELGSAVDPFVVHCLASVTQEIGAAPHILWTSKLAKGWWQELSPVVRAAIGYADVVVQNISSIGKTHMLDLMLEKKVRRFRNYASDFATMSSDWARFPVEVQDYLERKVNTMLIEAGTYRVAADDGTDISGEISKRLTAWRRDLKRSGGMNVSFPPSVFRASDSLNANGVIMVYSTYPWGARRVGLPEIRFQNPVKLVIENNYVVHIEGGWEAELYRKLFEEQATRIGQRSYYVDSWHSGASPRAFVPFDPRVDPDRFDHLAHNHECWFHFHLGGLSQKEGSKSQVVDHINAVCMNPTVYLGGQKVWEKGHLTAWNDPELREIAARYGDPDVLFAPRPIWE
jgi:2,5-dihydroxypyridine 5,6-dioxygenase